MAIAADRQAKASPFSYRVTLVDNIEGKQIARQVLPDGQTSEQMRHQFIGNFQGLRALKKLLDDREVELLDEIARQKHTELEQQQQSEQD